MGSIPDALVVSIDPGQRNGIAIWATGGVLITKAILDFTDLTDWLESEQSIIQLVMEDYITDFRAKKLKGSKNAASQTIGMVKAYARRRDIPLAIQRNTILKPTAMHAGVPVAAHFKDDVSAMLHGFHWFEMQGMRARDIRIS
jgi:hypothetical protein